MNASLLIALLGEAISDARTALLSQQFGITPDQVLKAAESDPTDGKYTAWILRQVRDGNLTGAWWGHTYSMLFRFRDLVRKPQWEGEKDLNRYDPATLKAALQHNAKIQTKGELRRRAEAEGMVFMAEKGDLTLYRIDNYEAADKHLRNPDGKGPWCVKDRSHWEKYAPPFYYLRRDPFPEQAEGWHNHYKLLVFPGLSASGKTSKFSCMDENNFDCPADEFIAMGLDFSPLFRKWRETIDYLNLWDRTDRWPEAEAFWIAEGNASALGAYATLVMAGQRFPEAEAIILTEPRRAVSYAMQNLGGKRWPEAEASIMTDAISVFRYCKHILHGPWPEAEALIGTWDEFDISEYARTFYPDGWPAGDAELARRKAIAPTRAEP